MSSDEDRRARVERVRSKLRSGEYQVDPGAIAAAILARVVARLRASRG
jgi:anti-sigma28 factor (negative regulator of flagellin synthesis)